MNPTTGHLAHFAINSDDLDSSRRFYEAIFGWRFEAWGPPDFFHIRDAKGDQPGPIGALQARRNVIGGRRPTAGFECTVAVDDADRAAATALAAGGVVLMEKTTISGVGDLVFVADPSGHPVGAMRYDSNAE